MVRTVWLDRLLAPVAALALVTAAAAQPPEGGPRDRGPGGPPHDQLRAALDADGDHELSADEIKNAAVAVAKLDRNGDGRIDHDEFRPPRPPMPPGGEGPPRGERPEGRPPREGRRPRPDSEREEGGPPRGGPGPERFVERAMACDADGDGKLDRTELEKFAGEMQRTRRGRGGPPDGGDRPRRPE